MILKKIKLKNFRQYYGEQELEFSIHPEKNITLIYGKNGAGKTSLFTALNWVLYGSSEVKIDGKIVNKKAIEEAKEKGKEFVKSEVILYFSHEGIDYQIKRTAFFDVKQEKEEVGKEEMEEIYPKIKKISSPLIKLNTILPPNVRTYFFFDGEKIDEFSKPEHDKEVKKAVYDVLGVTAIERAIHHVKDIVREYNKEMSQKSTGKLKELSEKYNTFLEEEDKLEKELENLKEERKNLEVQIGEIKGRLREIEEIEEQIKERDRLENRIKFLEKELEDIYYRLSEAINNSFYLIGSSAVETAEGIINKEVKDSDNIPKKYYLKLIEKILEEGKCICETPITPEKKESLLKKKIELKKEGEEPSQIIFSELYDKLSDLKYEKEKIKNTVSENFLRKSELKNELKELYEKKDELDQKLGNHSIENVRKLQNKLVEYSQDYGKIREKIEILEEELKNLKKEIEVLQKEIQTEEKKEKELSDLKKKKYLAEEVLRQLDIVYEKLSKGLKVEIEKATTEIFRRLIRKKGFFKEIKFSEDYILRLVDTFGDSEAKAEISAGERQILSLSFILGLAKVSKKEAPIVMDTPLGRLDPEHKENILKEIPYLARQVVLFVTPSEMTDDLRKLIDNKVGKEYELFFDEEEKYTKIISIGEKVCT